MAASSTATRALPRTIAAIAGLAAVYAAAAKLGLLMDAVSGFATLVWPAAGIALVALLRMGVRVWPGVFVGAFVVNVWTGAPPLVALGIAAGNTLEAVVGAWAIRRATGMRELPARVSEAVAFVGLA
ncbi:MAG TPA: MASE1 domain-containing protein, partial [Polyangia bacterium]